MLGLVDEFLDKLPSSKDSYISQVKKGIGCFSG